MAFNVAFDVPLSPSAPIESSRASDSVGDLQLPGVRTAVAVAAAAPAKSATTPRITEKTHAKLRPSQIWIHGEVEATKRRR